MFNIFKELKTLRIENEELKVDLRETIKEIRREQELRKTSKVIVLLKDWGIQNFVGANDYERDNDYVWIYKNKQIVASLKSDMVDLIEIKQAEDLI